MLLVDGAVQVVGAIAQRDLRQLQPQLQQILHIEMEQIISFDGPDTRQIPGQAAQHDFGRYAVSQQ